jgi:hypothetical protein
MLDWFNEDPMYDENGDEITPSRGVQMMFGFLAAGLALLSEGQNRRVRCARSTKLESGEPDNNQPIMMALFVIGGIVTAGVLSWFLLAAFASFF